VSEQTVDQLTLATTKIELYCNGVQLGPASGFYYRAQNRLFLVSNWHVFAGRHPKTLQPLHSSCWVPDEIEFSFAKIVPNAISFQPIRVPLMDENATQGWWEHPVLGRNVDIAVAELTGNYVGMQQFGAELEQGEELRAQVGMDVFVLGYPKGLAQQAQFPIWKRGSIASEPDYKVNDDELILIDTSTREGMSGAPVIASKREGVFKVEGRLKFGSRTRLLGVYSGRIGAENLQDVQLGLCWKKFLIDEIISGQKPGDLG
jgi:Trypsin-like peptidase domain